MKTLKQFCLDIAKADRQNEILHSGIKQRERHTGGTFAPSSAEYRDFERQIYQKAFSAKNKAIFQQRRAAMMEVLQHMNGRKWNEVMDALYNEAVSYVFLGFKIQDKLIELCGREGLRYED